MFTEPLTVSASLQEQIAEMFAGIPDKNRAETPQHDTFPQYDSLSEHLSAILPDQSDRVEALLTRQGAHCLCA